MPADTNVAPRSSSVMDRHYTIQLAVNCIAWAEHRRRKAPAKCHLRLDLLSFLPRFAIVDTAGEHDSVRAPKLCAGLRRGEIALFDQAYVHFANLWALTGGSVFWVARARRASGSK